VTENFQKSVGKNFKRITTSRNMVAMNTLSSVTPEPKFREEAIRKFSPGQVDDRIPATETCIVSELGRTVIKSIMILSFDVD